MTRRPPPPGEEGMILINVLLFVAIATGLVLLMVNREELALDGALRMREASRALAIVRGGEVSALVALRRDAIEAPQVDHAAEPWGALAESGIAIEGGTFDLVIADAEGRFNINSLRSGEAAPVIMFNTIARQVGLDEEQMLLAIAYVRGQGPITDLRPIRLAGVERAVADRLQRLVTALPGITQINLNAADREMLLLLFNDPAVVDRLIAVRDRQGFLTQQDLSDQNVTAPPGTRFASNTFWVRTRATIGSTAQSGAALIQRRPRDDGSIETVTVERWRNAAVPPEAPAFVDPA
ncbi:type II secretion system protein GspK [Sphingomonas sp. S1-29]|uniref:general secretion pathway protein GspK n=1 Tax=Sphingomonas sp. S1-29 TaxID=2991074 RepID=UPI00223F51E8|nr:type II secretion system protein GspK [Sphingomonas sp. S1-29]UZK70502.1 type II secretion system protein GspK [Sphingomonas sp. S1-29]